MRNIVMKPARSCKTLNAPYDWSQLPWGEYYRQTLEQQLSVWLGRLFGFHLLKIGNIAAGINTEECAISHQVNVTEQLTLAQVVASPLHLPFAAKSVDACLLLHSLAWCADPHRMLREADRVLIDDGWLIISGFNPFSIAGAGRMLPVLRRRPPYNSRMFSLTRQLDWLALLNFQVLHSACSHVLPWVRLGGKFPGAHLPALGCLQLIVARKRTIPLMPVPRARRSARVGLRQVAGANHQRHPRQLDTADQE